MAQCWWLQNCRHLLHHTKSKDAEVTCQQNRCQATPLQGGNAPIGAVALSSQSKLPVDNVYEPAHTQPWPSEAPAREGAASAAELPARGWLAKFTLDACQIQLSTECM